MSANHAGSSGRSSRPLSKAQWLDIRRGATLAKEAGAKALEVHGFAMWFPRPETQDAPLEPRSATQDCGTDGMAAETQIPAVPNSRQRRSAARRSRFVTGKRYASCKLRQVLLLVLRRRREERVQTVWLAWQRRERVLRALKDLLWREWTRRSDVFLRGPGDHLDLVALCRNIRPPSRRDMYLSGHVSDQLSSHSDYYTGDGGVDGRELRTLDGWLRRRKRHAANSPDSSPQKPPDTGRLLLAGPTQPAAHPILAHLASRHLGAAARAEQPRRGKKGRTLPF